MLLKFNSNIRCYDIIQVALHLIKFNCNSFQSTQIILNILYLCSLPIWYFMVILATPGVGEYPKALYPFVAYPLVFLICLALALERYNARNKYQQSTIVCFFPAAYVFLYFIGLIFAEKFFA